jgi:hypothetical protein
MDEISFEELHALRYAHQLITKTDMVLTDELLQQAVYYVIKYNINLFQYEYDIRSTDLISRVCGLYRYDILIEIKKMYNKINYGYNQ